MRDLNQRPIAWNNEFGVGIRLAEVAHRAVVNDPGAAIRAELDVRRTIEPAGAAHECLFECVVVGNSHNPAPKQFYHLSLHDALQISATSLAAVGCRRSLTVAITP